MAMSTTGSDEVSLRHDRLERENRRYKWIAAAIGLLVVVGGAVVLLGRDRSGREVVAERLVIRDKEGRLRASLGVDHSGLPGLKLFDRRGLEQIALEIPSDDLSVLAFSHQGENRVLLDTSIEGSTSLRLTDKADKSNAALFITPQGSAGVRVTNGTHADVLGLQPDADSPRPRPGRPVDVPPPSAADSITTAPAPYPALAASTRPKAK